MPHIIVKLWPGRSDELKLNMAKKVANVVSEELKVDIGDVSVSIEEIDRTDWEEVVYKKDIRDNDNIVVKPDYEY